MGWPLGMTSLESMKIEDFNKWKQEIVQNIWWKNDPADSGTIPRVMCGMKNRTKRLKAIGNGQVSLCLIVAWDLLNSF